MNPICLSLDYRVDSRVLAADVPHPGREMAPGCLLLNWAMRMVNDLAEDISAAWAEAQRLTKAARTSVVPAEAGER